MESPCVNPQSGPTRLRRRAVCQSKHAEQCLSASRAALAQRSQENTGAQELPAKSAGFHSEGQSVQ